MQTTALRKRLALTVMLTGMLTSATLGQQTIVETFENTRPLFPGHGNWATVTGEGGVEWFMYCISRHTYRPPNPGDTTFACFNYKGYLMARFPEAITQISFRARSFGDTARFQVFLNNQSLGIYKFTNETGQIQVIDIAQPCAKNLLKIQFLRISGASESERANIDDLAITVDPGITATCSDGWGHVHWMHNGFGEDPTTERYINWATPLSDSSTYVLYGETESLGQTESANVSCVVMPDTTVPTLDTILYHRVKLTGLSPATLYYYRCGGDSGLSDTYSFTTAPATDQPFSFGVVSDVQGYLRPSHSFDNCAEMLVDQGVDFWLQLGDLVQAGGTPGQWMAFFEGGRTVFEKIPLMAVRGNHEAYGDPDYYFTQGLFPYLDNPDRHYSFEYCNSLFVGLDNTRAAESASWLDDKLYNTTATWKFASWHTNPYSTGGHGGDALPGLLTNVLPIVQQYAVTTVFNGHSHAYEWTHPIAQMGNPPVLDKATVISNVLAEANTSQGTIFYNGAGVNSAGSINTTAPQEFTLTGDLDGGDRTALIAHVYPDSIIYEVVCYEPFDTYPKGHVLHTYKVWSSTTAAGSPPAAAAPATFTARYSVATGRVRVRGVAAGATVQVIDMSGRVRLCRTAELATVHLDLGRAPAGTYVVRVIDRGEVCMRGLVTR